MPSFHRRGRCAVASALRQDTRMRRFAVLASSVVLATCSEGPTGDGGDVPAVLLAAGDIARCTDTLPGEQLTAALLDTLPGAIAAVGDLAYPEGSAANFHDCYDPTWGRHKARTHPAPGNHEYITPGAAAYFAYFGAAAGDPSRGYYSYDLGAWHILSLNSEVDVSASSPQVAWIRADLAAHPTRCALAYYHRPRFSSGFQEQDLSALWQALYDGGVDVVLSGHAHFYERFAPLSGAGTPEPTGTREFIVGTGGAGPGDIGTVAANSEVRRTNLNGVLRLELGSTGYAWRFVDAAAEFTDTGTGTCSRR